MLCQESHASISVSYSHLHNMTNSITEIPEVQSAAARVASKTAPARRTAHTGVGKQLHTYRLIQHWVNLRDLAKDCKQTNQQTTSTLINSCRGVADAAAAEKGCSDL